MPQETGPSEPEPDDADTEFVEIDPSHRYGRYKEILGKGAFKKVYRAFDEREGIEVAWNQVKVADLLRNSVDLERLYSEVHLLKTLKHKNIIKFYNSWIDTKNEHINFITEIFTSGTLRQYRTKHKHVDLRALKKWSKQILEGLFYLHSHDPPVIHRDLKCDNIFVNGNQGEVKIGDLGLATILQQARSAHSVIGTPEFMAPELYEEEYNELVDIYAFGMCLLELVTLEYPYVECANAAQIYKKVTSGIKPASLGKVTDPTVKAFIEKCISEVSKRLSAEELLLDPFLQPDEERESAGHRLKNKAQAPGIAGGGCSSNPIDVSDSANDSTFAPCRGVVVEGETKDVDTIFVKLRIADYTGRFHKIHFPFDVEADTPFTVATEMVQELDLSDQDVPTIAAMIKSDIRSHIPDWVSSVENLSEETNETDPATETKDDASPVRNEASPLALEILPSGRKYWSDSHKACGGVSPSRPGNSNLPFQESFLGNPVEGDNSSNEVHSLEQFQAETMPHNDDKNKAKMVGWPGDSSEVTVIAQNLENLLLKQRKERFELESKQELQRLQFLDQISPETRLQVLNACKLKFPVYGQP